MFNLQDTVSVVIGGNGVLGSAMAAALAEAGSKVAIIGRDMEKARLVREKIERNGGEAAIFEADATKKDELESVLNHVLLWGGRVDTLVNASGTNSPTPFFDLEMDEWDRIMDVNLKSVVLACQVFGKKMIEQCNGGSIINISSVSSAPPLSRVFTYSASKSGVNSVTQFLAREFAPDRVRVNAIIPGFFPAEQNKKILSPDRIESIMQHTPMNRFGDPEELKGAVVYLASSKASSFVTGTLLRVDGGFGAMTI
ncbi:SDR family oxidoreductase [Paenibacillus macquariensis]|uniref:NAD(P)-dependent dehydrogenase, short-chain alcohol dehydrogenase family n=1 Tax=Paenibacillus macquariensis TaxID=948756 RepID=A0ABY1JN11_9BACL|nr:SDR family oxidoreductase [Paenibacillus macquariensis]MEC0092223.1 SDR family oxidoreductase [Paenibacillus macquariensis]OAB37229.1 gluconate 5-dehydrogenase [Paenibacillus macquariensis subsp. macquariensis]SIQ48472.1 NAD(P)-dependent dehydrogenase, short-chain alcohol dehydrogenase family [Paenibacillus macquariensis]